MSGDATLRTPRRSFSCSRGTRSVVPARRGLVAIPVACRDKDTATRLSDTAGYTVAHTHALARPEPCSSPATLHDLEDIGERAPQHEYARIGVEQVHRLEPGLSIRCVLGAAQMRTNSSPTSANISASLQTALPARGLCLPLGRSLKRSSALMRASASTARCVMNRDVPGHSTCSCLACPACQKVSRRCACDHVWMRRNRRRRWRSRATSHRQ